MTFIFLSLQILTWLCVLSGLVTLISNYARRQVLYNNLLDLQLKQQQMLILSDHKAKKELPDAVKFMMQNSASHPEAQEIEASDELVGVIFEGNMYPPDFDDDEDDYEEA